MNYKTCQKTIKKAAWQDKVENAESRDIEVTVKTV